MWMYTRKANTDNSEKEQNYADNQYAAPEVRIIETPAPVQQFNEQYSEQTVKPEMLQQSDASEYEMPYTAPEFYTQPAVMQEPPFMGIPPIEQPVQPAVPFPQTQPPMYEPGSARPIRPIEPFRAVPLRYDHLGSSQARNTPPDLASGNTPYTGRKKTGRGFRT